MGKRESIHFSDVICSHQAALMVTQDVFGFSAIELVDRCQLVYDIVQGYPELQLDLKVPSQVQISRYRYGDAKSMETATLH